MIFFWLHFPAKAVSYFLDTKELGTGELSWWIYDLEMFYLKKLRCAKSQEFKGNVFVFRKILLEVGELGLWRAQLGAEGMPPGHGPKSCQDWLSLLCVNLLPSGLLSLLTSAEILVAELPQVQGTR